MKKSPLIIFLESWGNTLLGFAGSLAIQAGVCWWYSLPLALFDNLSIIGAFTVWSLARNYGWGWLMEALHVRRPLSPFMQAVIAERYRQQELEGWSPAHDDDHSKGQLARAGAAYLIGPERNIYTDYEANDEDRVVSGRLIWPWNIEWWKPADFRRNLVRGCALAIAEGERFDRNRKRDDRVPVQGGYQPKGGSAVEAKPPVDDPLGLFLAECTYAEPAGSVSAGELYAAYQLYAARQAWRGAETRLAFRSARAFHRAMRERGYRLFGGAIRRWGGLWLKPPASDKSKQATRKRKRVTS